jgi:hypothetical protein
MIQVFQLKKQNIVPNLHVNNPKGGICVLPRARTHTHTESPVELAFMEQFWQKQALHLPAVLCSRIKKK